MEDSNPFTPRRTCPHCGKEIPKLPPRPRDLSLLINCLIYRVPPEKEITGKWIEVARKHCKMKPERLAELRQGAHARHWPRMLARRAARIEYLKQHGELPPRWMPLLPGEHDHRAAIEGYRRYRKGGFAKLKSRLRKRPDATSEKLTNQYLSIKKIRSPKRKADAINRVVATLVAQAGIKAGNLTLKEFEAIKPALIEGRKRG